MRDAAVIELLICCLIVAAVFAGLFLRDLVEEIKMLRLIVYVTESKVTALQIDVNSRGAFKREYDIDDVRGK